MPQTFANEFPEPVKATELSEQSQEPIYATNGCEQSPGQVYARPICEHIPGRVYARKMCEHSSEPFAEGKRTPSKGVEQYLVHFGSSDNLCTHSKVIVVMPVWTNQ